MRHPLNSLAKILHPSKKTVLLVLAVVAITILLSTIVSIWLSKVTNLKVPSLGTLKTLGVEAYWDANLTDKIDVDEKLDWGTLWLGSSNDVTIYLLSISNIETTLNQSKANLAFHNASEVAIHPPNNIATYMCLSWNYNGSRVKPSEVIQVTLTLSADYSSDFISYLVESDIKSFSFDILISTTEYTT
jgi:hypothetical protein